MWELGHKVGIFARNANMNIYILKCQMDASRKAEVSQMEAKLLVTSHKLAAYEHLEAELDKAIEQFAPSGMLEDEREFPAALLHITNGHGVPVLPTLASRRLEHCIKLSRRLTQLEEAKRLLAIENEKLKAELEVNRILISTLFV